MLGYTEYVLAEGSFSYGQALSHANRLLPSKQLTAMCLLKMTREHIPGWLSVMLKVSCAGDAGTQLNTQLAS